MFGREAEVYRIGFPMWRWVARLGVTVRVRVDVRRAQGSLLYVATSGDLDNLVVEARSLDELIPEINVALEGLLRAEMEGYRPRVQPELRIRDHVVDLT